MKEGMTWTWPYEHQEDLEYQEPGVYQLSRCGWSLAQTAARDSVECKPSERSHLLLTVMSS